MNPFRQNFNKRKPSGDQKTVSIHFDWLSFVLVESAPFLHQDPHVTVADSAIEPRLIPGQKILPGDVWQIKAFVGIRLLFQLVPLFEKEREFVGNQR
jgi:hypothetical protein